jgi:tRNA/rRNA methyltransferase
MKNMGLSRLTLAAPRSSYDLEELRRMATHSIEVYESRTESATLAEAVSDCRLVVGTTARAGLYREHCRTPREWAPAILQSAAGGAVALVFGPEDRGLSNDELKPCTRLIHIPSSELHPSLNLAQAVMVCAYELYLAAGVFEIPQERSFESSSVARERMFALWREAMLAIGFMNEDKADHMMLGLRRALGRGSLSNADVRILMGIARQTLWMARHRPHLPAPLLQEE